MVQQRRTFTEEFKREAVAKQSGAKPATVARDHVFSSQHPPIWATRTMCLGFLAVASMSGKAGRQASDSVKMIGSSRRFGQAMNERHCTYGAPRVFRDLRDAGEGCSESRIAR
jgi:hypothetical protein